MRSWRRSSQPDHATAADEELGRLAASTPGFLPPSATAAAVVACLGQQRINMFMIASNAQVQRSPGQDDEAVIGAGCYPRTAILNPHAGLDRHPDF